MNAESVFCSGCSALLPTGLADSETSRCRSCGESVWGQDVPRSLGLPRTHLAQGVLDQSESSCFYHAENRATVPCDGCGRFLCGLCALDVPGSTLCPSCLRTGVTGRRIETLEDGRTMQDSIALALSTLPFALIWPAFISAPLAIFWSIRHWNSPRSIIPRSRIRLYLAITFSLLEILLFRLCDFRLRAGLEARPMNAASLMKASVRHRTFTGYSQVWLAQDHVLVLRSQRLQEKYRRFLFADIQAIVITEGPDSSIPRALFGVGVLILVAWAASATTFAGRAFLGILGLFAAGMLVRDVMRGPRCRCVLQTAINREKIDALSRTHGARSFLELVSPLIQRSQQHIQASDAAPVSGFAVPSEATLVPTPPQVPEKPGFAAESFFGLLFLTGVLILAGSGEPLSTLFGLLSLVYVSELVLGVIAAAEARTAVQGC